MTFNERSSVEDSTQNLERLFVISLCTGLFASVPVAMIYMTYFEVVLPGVIAGASDFLIWTTYLTACGMIFIWVGLSHRYELWQHYGHFVLLSSGLEIISMGLQRFFYWLYRMTEVWGRCQFGHPIKELCDTHNAIAQATIVPASLQWIAAIGLIGICSPVLAEYCGRYWYLTSAAALVVIWVVGLSLILSGAPT